MKSYTLRDLSYNVSGEKLILPFDAEVKDEEIIDKVISLFSKVKFYERELFSDKLETAAVSVDKYGDVVIQCLYEGHDDYYKFSLRFEVFRLKYDGARRIYYKTFREVEEGQWMAAMMIESEHGALLEELVELKSLPKFFENAELENYIMKFD
jgi:S-adenosylmethionine hydrolase